MSHPSSRPLHPASMRLRLDSGCVCDDRGQGALSPPDHTATADPGPAERVRRRGLEGRGEGTAMTLPAPQRLLTRIHRYLRQRRIPVEWRDDYAQEIVLELLMRAQATPRLRLRFLYLHAADRLDPRTSQARRRHHTLHDSLQWRWAPDTATPLLAEGWTTPPRPEDDGLPDVLAQHWVRQRRGLPRR